MNSMLLFFLFATDSKLLTETKMKIALKMER